MNLREGTRRLALLLGVAGAIVGGFASYMELQTALTQRTAHQHFERLVNSGIVQQTRKALESPFDLSAGFEGPPIPSTVNKGGIRTINWIHDYAVQSIVTTDGQTLYPTPSPGGWSYFLIVILPLLGFLIPWGSIRVIGWVGAGFVQSVGHT